MSRYLRRAEFTPSCPAGGSWYACANSKFVGCCASDPCAHGCSDGNLRPVTFPKDQYAKFPDASCGLGSRFYTCAENPDGPFWGCCKSNPCGSGCPDGDLTGAFVGEPGQLSVYSLTGSGMSSTATASRTVTLETRTTSTATAERVTVTSSPAPAEKPIAAIAGGAAGGGVGLAIIIGLLIYYICHAKKSRDKHKDEVEQRLSGATLTKDNPTDNKTSPISPPPTYYSPDPNSPHDAISPASSHTHHHEMASGALSPTPSHLARKANAMNRLSELSGDTARRSELETPWATPHPNTWTPPRSPHSATQHSPHARDHAVQDRPAWTDDQTPYALPHHISPVYAQPAPQNPRLPDLEPLGQSPSNSRLPSAQTYPPEPWTPDAGRTRPARQSSRTFQDPERTAQWVDSHPSPHRHDGMEIWPEYDEHAGYPGNETQQSVRGGNEYDGHAGYRGDAAQQQLQQGVYSRNGYDEHAGYRGNAAQMPQQSGNEYDGHTEHWGHTTQPPQQSEHGRDVAWHERQRNDNRGYPGV